MRIDSALLADQSPSGAQRWASGVASLDAALGGGVAYGCIHEAYAAQAADAAAATGFVIGLTTGMTSHRREVMWLRWRHSAGRDSPGLGGVLQANGWAELGGAPGHALCAIIPDIRALLRTAVDALRCPALGAVIVEGWGQMRELDLTASRRLALAAEKSGVPLFLLRIDAPPVPSAARTRWQVAAAPSHALPGNAPGRPTFDITLLRQRSGPSGMDWRLEWDRDRRTFLTTTYAAKTLSGVVVSVPPGRTAGDRAAGDRTPGPVRPDDRRAA